ncbi:hypothetical protein E2562_002771 [Oryza meyeriana var. granulata]|uniref:Epidermal patterning factor-like protein n=1 Tax=Oryza meyeriana var. granulata TaxID=110450 RepID=A0A6G1BRA3_9ORYZ|nr:hypothetical protein E2562_002771 [Oryza meyeriana var. granulata]
MRMFSARALAFAFVAVVMGSCVADAVRTTPAGGLHDGAAPSAANGSGAGQTTLQVDGRHQPQQQGSAEEEMEIDGGAAATGSRLPDCTHACGPCSPCRRVMVSLRCAEAAESCPVAYRCMCRGRFFRVPTL